MTVILGIDPGSRRTGFGLIRIQGSRHHYVASGVIRVPEGELPSRLQVIFAELGEVICSHRPDEAAIEQVFLARNAQSALKLGQARGAAIVAATQAQLPVFEYEARKVKQAVTGTGAADKKQVQHMVRSLLALPANPQEDAADALAVALCHAHTRQNLIRMAGNARFRRGRVV